MADESKIDESKAKHILDKLAQKAGFSQMLIDEFGQIWMCDENSLSIQQLYARSKTSNEFKTFIMPENSYCKCLETIFSESSKGFDFTFYKSKPFPCHSQPSCIQSSLAARFPLFFKKTFRTSCLSACILDSRRSFNLHGS